MAGESRAQEITAAEVIDRKAMQYLKRSRRRLLLLLIPLCLLLIWVGTGVLMNRGVLPYYDLGYDWLRSLIVRS